MLGSPPMQHGALREETDRIAKEIQGLALRRRESIDTVRSSEFGEGGRWDRAWGGSDDDEDDDDDFNGRSLSELDIEGRGRSEGNALDRLEDSQWYSRQEDKRAPLTARSNALDPNQFPQLYDAPGVQHTVSLTPSMQRQRKSLDPNDQQKDGLYRRDTMTSIVGDVGWETPVSTSPRDRDSMQTITAPNRDSRQSLSSQNSHSNAHVYVWPPTPAASDHGGSSESDHAGDSERDALRAYSPGIGQRATIETVQAEPSTQKSTPQKVWTPSAALAHPMAMPTSPDNKSKASPSRAVSGHPTGRLPPQPPLRSLEDDRYADPNQPLSSSSQIADLGAARRKAIADHDGRESIVSDLDVETLQLDDGESRRGSVASVGSFNSDKIRDQRQRQSQISMYSSYSQESRDASYSDKRSSNGTIREDPLARQKADMQHRSWNGSNMQHDGLSLLSSPEQNGSWRRGPPKRSNTGPDSYLPGETSQAKSRLSTGTIQDQQRSTSNPQAQASSLTFAIPQIERTEKKPSIAVKGAIQDTQAERFLSLAITHHESGDLSRSAYYFERSAKVDGGCIVGMCMWGMALREGWGVRKDAKKGFEWISRAASKAGELMAGTQSIVKSEAELKAIRSELKLSVYELGKCFCYGWGIKMDKPMALEYFELAARLGDADAQAEAGALLAAGKGCKKDLKKAAMYYRMAEAQGYDTVGLSWIHKDKYDPVK
jgi:TPR repeat protein